MDPAFFEPSDAGLIPHPDARGPWAPDMMHGRLLAGLAGWAIERDVATPEMRIARLTVDLFRAAPLEPVHVTTTVVRDGRRVKAADAVLACGGHDVARASALLLRTVDDEPPADVWSAEPWDVPRPDDLEPLPDDGDMRRYGWDMRPITEGGFRGEGQRRLWVRERRQLVAGVETTPFMRVATVADLANPLSNSGTGGLHYINADLTLAVRRYPATEWIGFEVSHHVAANGIAVAGCTLYDEDGPLGTSTVTAVATAPLAP